MKNPDLPDRDRKLTERLKRDAAASRPVFSEARHERLRSAIERARIEATRSFPSRTSRRWPVTLRIAALLLLGVTVALWTTADRWGSLFHDDPGSVTTHGTSPLSELEALAGMPDRVAAGIGALVDAVGVTRQWADLDHDARAAAWLFLEQLPLGMFAPSGDP